MKYRIALLAFFFSTALLAQEEGIFNALTGQAYSPEMVKSMFPGPIDFFAGNNPLKFDLTSDLKKIAKERNDPKKQTAWIAYTFNDTLEVVRKIKIKARGNFRRGYCQYPPLKLNMKKVEPYFELEQSMDKMKLVSNCRGGKFYEGYVMREYLIYKMFNLFSPMSFRVKLLDITYTDTGREKKNTRSTYAFLIEEVDDLATRNDGVEIEKEGLRQGSIQNEHMALVAMFQYMIGNTDWSVPGLHNVKLIKKMDVNEPLPYAVPYDFDYTGMVNASYAVPPETLPIKSVRDRLYRGNCYSDEVFESTIQQFKDKKTQLFDLVNQNEFLTERDQKDMLNYMSQFFETIESKSALYVFKNNCAK